MRPSGCTPSAARYCFSYVVCGAVLVHHFHRRRGPPATPRNPVDSCGGGCRFNMADQSCAVQHLKKHCSKKVSRLYVCLKAVLCWSLVVVPETGTSLQSSSPKSAKSLIWTNVLSKKKLIFKQQFLIKVSTRPPSPSYPLLMVRSNAAVCTSTALSTFGCSGSVFSGWSNGFSAHTLW